MRVMALLALVCLTAGLVLAAEPGLPPLVAARLGFRTMLRPEVNPPGNEVQPPVTPPRGEYRLVRYPSKVGMLAAYVTPRPADGKKRPAVLWAKGGFGGLEPIWESQTAESDQTPQAFKDAGFVVMVPSWRAQGNNPGRFEMLYGEVDDAVAAIDYLARLPGVDSSRIYMVGHSTGGTMTLLTAQATTKLRAAFALGGCPDLKRLAANGKDADEMPFDVTRKDEVPLRSASHCVAFLKTPSWYFEADVEQSRSAYLADVLRMGRDGISCRAPFHTYIMDGATHSTMIRPVTRMLAQKMLEDTGTTCDISISPQDLQTAWQQVFPGRHMECSEVVIPQMWVTDDVEREVSRILREKKWAPERIALVIQGSPTDPQVHLTMEPGNLELFSVITTRGVQIAVDYRIADKMVPSIVRLAVDPQTGTNQFQVRARGQRAPASQP